MPLSPRPFVMTGTRDAGLCVDLGPWNSYLFQLRAWIRHAKTTQPID